MFETLKSADNVLAFGFSGELTADDIRQYQSLFHQKLKSHGQFGAVIDFSGLSDMSPKAFEKGAQADMEFLAHIGQFPRIALVSDKHWPTLVDGMLTFFLPAVETRVFAAAEQDKAITWAAEAPATPGAAKAGGGMRTLPTEDKDVFAFEINGVMSKDSIGKLVEDVEAYFAKHEKVKLLARIKHFKGIDLSVLTQPGLLSMKFDAMKKSGQYAIVGAPGWMEKAVKMVDPMVVSLDMKTFAANHEDDAWEWLGAKHKA